MMVALRGTDIVRVPLAEGTAKLKTVSAQEYEEVSILLGG
jgi:6-phosphofructokinase 1